MKTSNKGINLIKKFEGCRLEAYKCSSGVWTIGFGHTANVKKGDVITQETAERMLVEDLARYEKSVNNWNSKYNFTQNEFDALVSFTYNCGAGNLKKLLCNGTRTKPLIADRMLLYNKSAGQVLQALSNRRRLERELFLSTEPSSYKEVTDDVITAVIRGNYGNGEVRKVLLAQDGYSFDEVQQAVNNRLNRG